MLTRVTMKKDFRCFKEGETFELRPYTLLVGDQGCGKSTLLQTLKESSTGTNDRIDVELLAGRGAVFFDFEKDNPRSKSDVRSMLCPLTELSMRFWSHGETVRAILKSVPPELILLVDEPDMALAPRTVYWLSGLFKDYIVTGGQVIAAVHNPILMEEAGDVLSIEHRRWMTASEFLDAHRNEKENQ